MSIKLPGGVPHATARGRPPPEAHRAGPAATSSASRCRSAGRSTSPAWKATTRSSSPPTAPRSSASKETPPASPNATSRATSSASRRPSFHQDDVRNLSVARVRRVRHRRLLGLALSLAGGRRLGADPRHARRLPRPGRRRHVRRARRAGRGRPRRHDLPRPRLRRARRRARPQGRRPKKLWASLDNDVQLLVHRAVAAEPVRASRLLVAVRGPDADHAGQPARPQDLPRGEGPARWPC